LEVIIKLKLITTYDKFEIIQLPIMVVPESKGKTLSVLALMSEEGIIKH